MKEKEIVIVVGDIGGAREMVFIDQALKKISGVRTRWILDRQGKAGSELLDRPDILQKLDAAIRHCIPYDTVSPAGSWKPDLIAVGTSATAIGAQIEWTQFGVQEDIPVFWMEDWHATGSRKAVRHVHPDVMGVIDSVAAGIASLNHPRTAVHEIGRPSGESLASLIAKRKVIRKRVRSGLDIGEEQFLITWACGGAEMPASTWNQVRSFEKTLTLNHLDFLASDERFLFTFRFNPKNTEADQLYEYVGNLPVCTVDSRSHDFQDVVLASDAYAADWSSSDSFTALLAGIPVITVLFPDDRERRSDAGFINEVPPVLAGYPLAFLSWGVWDAPALCQKIIKIFYGIKDARAMTRKRARIFRKLLEPGAADRAAKILLGLLER